MPDLKQTSPTEVKSPAGAPPIITCAVPPVIEEHADPFHRARFIGTEKDAGNASQLENDTGAPEKKPLWRKVAGVAFDVACFCCFPLTVIDEWLTDMVIRQDKERDEAQRKLAEQKDERKLH